MPFFLDLLDKIGKKPQTQEARALDSSRVLGVGENAIALRLPNTSQSAQVASRVFRNLGNENTIGVDTDPTILNLDGLIENKADGNIKIDFTSLGGRIFEGSRADLSNLAGQDLLTTIGNAAFQNNSGGQLNIGNNANAGRLLAGQATQTQAATANLNTLDINDDTRSIGDMLKGLENTEISSGLSSRLEGLTDDEGEELIKLFRAAASGS